jgi:hypothetical protein
MMNFYAVVNKGASWVAASTICPPQCRRNKGENFTAKSESSALKLKNFLCKWTNFKNDHRFLAGILVLEGSAGRSQ